MKKLLKAAVAVSVALACTPAFADKNDKNEVFSSSTFKAMELRNIGPAYMSGRIADIAVDQIVDAVVQQTLAKVVQGLVAAASGSEAVGEVAEVLLINLLQQQRHRLRDDFVVQGGDG